jgi:hypothetical protein
VKKVATALLVATLILTGSSPTFAAQTLASSPTAVASRADFAKGDRVYLLESSSSFQAGYRTGIVQRLGEQQAHVKLDAVDRRRRSHEIDITYERLQLNPSSGETRRLSNTGLLLVFVTSAAAANGFTDPSKARRDSIRDVSKALNDSKMFRTVPKADDARVVIEVMDRSTRREVNGMTFLTGHAQNKSTLAVRFIIPGNYETEFSGESGSSGMFTGYADAANKVVKQIKQWAIENRAQLDSLVQPIVPN